MARRPPPGAPALARTKETITAAPIIMVFCEGETERHLLDGLRQSWRIACAQVRVVGSCGDPRAVVRAAKEHHARLPALDRKHARVYVVFDRDEHHHFNDAIQQALDMGFTPAWSNPCIELWGLLLHVDHESEIDRHQAQRRLASLHKGYHHQKNPRFDFALVVEGALEAAERRASRLDKHAAELNEPYRNPTTRFGLVVSALRGATLHRGVTS